MRRRFTSSLYLLAVLTGWLTFSNAAWSQQWNDITPEQSKLEILKKKDDIVAWRGRTANGVWQEHVQFSDVHIVASSLPEKAYRISGVEEEHTKLAANFKSLVEKGFKFERCDAVATDEDPLYYCIARRDAGACVLFRKYLDHPGSPLYAKPEIARKSAQFIGTACQLDTKVSDDELKTLVIEMSQRAAFKKN